MSFRTLKTVARPCLVLLDYTMPGAGAEGFLSAIEALPDAETFVVVLMSGMRGVRIKVGNRIAANLPKPFEMDDLLAMLQTHCGTRPSVTAS